MGLDNRRRMSGITIGTPSKVALLVLDCQNAIYHPTYWGNQRSNPPFEQNLTRLLELFRARKLPTFHVEHNNINNAKSPLHPSNAAGVAFMLCAVPQDGEPVFIKTVNSAFIGTKLEEAIRAQGVQTLFIAGFETDKCVSMATRMAADLGVVGKQGTMYIIADALANYEHGKYDAETVHAIHVATLQGEFAEVAEVEDVEHLVTTLAGKQ